MVRGNRRVLVASSFLAVPAALFMASLSVGTPPEGNASANDTGNASPPAVQQAVGTGETQPGAIQQVVGKQPRSRTSSRPMGIFSGFGSSKESNKASSQTSQNRSNHNHSAQKKQPEKKDAPRGLLDGFFKKSTAKKSTSSNNKQTHNHKSQPSRAHSTHAHSSHKQSAAHHGRSDAENWDGIPYHNVSKNQNSRSNSSPISDPDQTEVASNGGTRIIRGGSSRTIDAKPASVRRQPTLAAKPSPSIAAPRPASKVPTLAAPIPSRPSVLSSGSSSSRRGDRRSIGGLDASELAAAGRASLTPVEDQSDDLVPKVSRRRIEVAKPEPKIAKKPAPTPAAAPEKVARKSLPKTESPALAPAPAATKEVAAAQPEQAPSTSLAAPKAQPTYNEPAVPTPQIAASAKPSTGTPSMSVGHRSGPPQAAFAPVDPKQSQFDAPAPQYDSSAPVGSGIALPSTQAESNVAQLQPPQQTAPNYDPYAATPATPQLGAPSPAPGRLSTTGQPIAAPAERVAQRPARPSVPTRENATVPMHAIRGNAAGSPAVTETADNFASSNFDARNQMRNNLGIQGASRVASELPGIRVVTNGPSAVMIRQTNPYEIIVENRGSIAAEGLMVRALVPDWAELKGQNSTRGNIEAQTQGTSKRLVWTIDQLPAGASERMSLQLRAERSGTYDLDVDWTLVPQKNIAKVQVHEPKLGLSIDGPDEVVFGKSQTYKVRVLNPGDGIAPNVVFTLSPNSATPQTQRIGDIPPGKEAQFEVELTAQDLGDLKIHGLASGDLELRAEAAKTIRVSSAKLEAVLTGPELRYQNTESAYNLQVQNTGSATSEKISASLRLPTGATYLGGIDGAQLRGQDLRWEIESLAPGATRSYQFRCNMDAPGQHQFAFQCRGSAAGKASVAIATRVESIADLVLSVSDPTAPAPIGSDVTYEIVVRNRGSKEATDVQTVAQFSHGIEPQRIEGQSGEVVTGQVLFDAIPRIAPGQEIRMRVIAKADRGGHHRFRTEVRAGDTVLVAEEATHYVSASSERVSRRSSDSSNK